MLMPPQEVDTITPIQSKAAQYNSPDRKMTFVKLVTFQLLLTLRQGGEACEAIVCVFIVVQVLLCLLNAFLNDLALFLQ